MFKLGNKPADKLAPFLRTDAPVLPAAAAVGGFTLAVRAIGLVKLIVIARQYGISSGVDAFLLAFLVPSFLADAYAGSVSTALVPVFVAERVNGAEDCSRRLLAEVTGYSIVVLGILGAMLACVARYLTPVVASGFTQPDRELTKVFLTALAPLLLLAGLGGTWRAALYAAGRFAVAAAIPAATPVATIAVVLAAGGRFGVWALVAGSLGGSLLELLAAGTTLAVLGYFPFPRIRNTGSQLRQVLRQSVPLFGVTGLMSASTMIDQAMAAALGPGNVASLAYGTRLTALAIALGPAAVGTAAFPFFSTMAAAGRWTQMRRALKRHATAAVLVSLPVTLLLAVFSPLLVVLLFQHGAFTGADAATVSLVQRASALQLPFAFVLVLTGRMVSSMGWNTALFRGAVLHLAATIVFDLLFMHRFGVAGIPCAASLTAAINTTFLAGVVWRPARRSLGFDFEEARK